MFDDKAITLGLVAARKGSKGIPNKNLLKVNGKELVRVAVEIGLTINEIDLIICSTDSEKIASVAKDAGAEVPFLRPNNLAEDHTPMIPVMEHAINEVESKYRCFVDRVVIIDPTSPLRLSEDIKDVIKFHNNNNADLIVSVHKGHYNPYFNMLEKRDDYYDLPKGKDENYGSRQMSPAVYLINTLVWIYTRNAIMIEKKRIPEKTLVYCFPEERSIDLDTPEDLKKIEYRLSCLEEK
tara:strand:+ start:1231 stop:1944 length:714 start_codon:yes stop_codon:yes gene_type:complete